MEPKPRTGRNRTKVKSGCVTCKIRKLKCDEGRPACNRCVSTGRVCDGYGIWGSGGNKYGYRPAPAVSHPENPQLPQEMSAVAISPQGTVGGRALAPRPAANVSHAMIAWLPGSVSPLVSGADERNSFEWFKYRTTTKLPASFISGFWTKLILQATMVEPAVFHAVLALSSVHRKGTQDIEGSGDDVPDEHEQFALKHYVKAISFLQPHFILRGKASSRVALITCVVFVCLEILRGYIKTAQTHLQNGLRILEEMQVITVEEGWILRLKPCQNPTDDWIVEAFCRLQLQVMMFKHIHHQSDCKIIRMPEPEVMATRFHSVLQSWRELERLLNRVFSITHQSRIWAEQGSKSAHDQDILFDSRQRIQEDFSNWLKEYERFYGALSGPISDDDVKCDYILKSFYVMGAIMASVCLAPDEMAYDSHTKDFAAILGHLQELRAIGISQLELGRRPDLTEYPTNLARSIIDVGWLQPLYYTAVKCRDHQLRHRASILLDSSAHREGFWDSKVVARMARKIVDIEEGSFYKDLGTLSDHASLDTNCLSGELFPVLPETCRISEVKAALSGGPMEKISLVCKQRQCAGDGWSVATEYDIHLDRWVGKECT